MASVVLLVSSGLLIRALLAIQSVDPGFRAEDVLTLRTAAALAQVRAGPRSASSSIAGCCPRCERFPA